MNKYMIIKIFFSICFLYSELYASSEHNSTVPAPYNITYQTTNLTNDLEYNTTIDTLYNSISFKVLEYSESLDKYISAMMGREDTNNTCLTSPVTSDNYATSDYFFQNNRYLNETRDIYIRLRLDNRLYSQRANRIKGKISAQLPFDRCKKQWNIYIDNSSTQKDEIKATDTSNNGVGIRYYGKKKFGIDSSYSIGFSNQSPYFRARYKLPFEYKSWLIEPIQTFKYSHKDFFEEESNIYFDKYLTQKQLFRIQLHRKSASQLKGTDYGVIFQYYINLGKDSGLEFTQSFFGNTHYNHIYADDKEYSGINNFVTSVSWRENIWRKWLYYEIIPSVNHHKDHNYNASYSLRFLVDIYFGLFH